MATEGVMRLLKEFADRLERKPFLSRLTRDWESRVRIHIANQPEGGITLTFWRGSLQIAREADEVPINLHITGEERDLVQLLSGDEWELLKAMQKVAARGSVRDQLKWEALLRLTCASQ